LVGRVSFWNGGRENGVGDLNLDEWESSALEDNLLPRGIRRRWSRCQTAFLKR